MSPALVIRPMTEADREAVIDLLWELNRVEDAIAHDRATTRADAAACLAHLVAASADGGALLVAELGGSVVGFLALAIEAGQSFIRADLRRHGNVMDLIVAAAHRRKGIASRLLAQAEMHTRQAGCAAMLIGVLEGNVAAQSVYAAQGFRRYTLEMVKFIEPGSDPLAARGA